MLELQDLLSGAHWRKFHVPKRSGGVRVISAPSPTLKGVQRQIITEVEFPVHPAAHGFVEGRSIVTNAAVHVGKEVVVNLDLHDFFPSITSDRVEGLFRQLGYSVKVAAVLAQLTTKDGCLPQGSPCSPAITNAICFSLDNRLDELARKLCLTYTRYADDLTFSGSLSSTKGLPDAVKEIVEAEGFTLHPDKTKVQYKNDCQLVTGIVVNTKLGVQRQLLLRWRAVVHQIERDGPEGKHFGPSDDVFSSLLGFAAFVKMVDPPRGRVMLTKAKALATRYNRSAS
jgi:retron-type reverse transcriptase